MALLDKNGLIHVKTQIKNLLNTKVDIDQGAENYGKILTIDSAGSVTPNQLDKLMLTYDEDSRTLEFVESTSSYTQNSMLNFFAFDGLSENLFNKKTVTDNAYRYSGSGYGILNNSGMCVSDFIPVEPNETYLRSANSFESTGTVVSYQHTFYFDANKNVIGVNRHYYGSKSFVTPDNCAYIQINLPMDCKDIAMVIKGSVEPSEYIPYVEYYRLGNMIRIGVNNFNNLQELFKTIPNGAIDRKALSNDINDSLDSIDTRINNASQWNDINQVTETLSGRINMFEHVVKGVLNITSDISDQTIVVHGVNYFDVNDMVSGTMDESTGEITDAANGFYTKHLIPVQPGKVLFWSRDYKANAEFGYLRFHLYDKDQNWIGKYGIGAALYCNTYTVPENVFFIRVYEGLLSGTNLNNEKLQITDVDTGNTFYSNGFPIGGVNNSSLYFGKTVYFPYIGYRIENGVLLGASDTYTVEEITHVDVFNSESMVDVTAPIEYFDKNKLQNVCLQYGRYGDTDYVIARIFKNTITGKTICPRVVTFTPGGQTISNYAKENDFVMGINAGIFNTDDNSCLGTTISDGVVITDHIASTFSGMGDTLGINSSGDFVSQSYETTTDEMLESGTIHAVHGWGTIILNYAKSDLDALKEVLYPADGTYGSDYIVTAKHPRTAVGQFKNGDYMVFCCGGRGSNEQGMTLAEMQDIFVAKGVKFAYNLDGGGSCNMMFYKKELASYTENRSDPSYIIFN